MDMDMIDETEYLVSSSAKVFGKKPTFVPIDDAHPFDLESYIAAYSGRTAVDRLTHIISVCPTIAPQAYVLALARIQEGRDPGLYQSLITAYETVSRSVQDGSLTPVTELPMIDIRWIETTNTKNNAEKSKLEVELKTYTTNLIRESIRMAHRDLGHFFRSIGDYSSSLKHYSKSREFCSSSQHVVDMCMSVLELLLEQRNYSHVPTYVFKADGALDSSAARSNVPPNAAQAAQLPPDAQLVAKQKAAAEREKVQTKLDVATGLSYLGQGTYDKAAQAFLKAGPVKNLDEWANKIVGPGDVAIYGTLCALATYSRSAIKTAVLENDNFGVYIEQEPYVRELIEAYMSNKFKVVLETLEKFSTRHYTDIYLSNHVNSLVADIQNRALILYFQPFATIKLERMSQAFGWTVERLEQQIVHLIQKGDIQARVDRQNKILKAKTVDQRAELFARAVKSGTDMQATNRKLLLRMRLQQADLIVKQPKTGTQNVAMADLLMGGGDAR
ncbi:hypothetical protein QCA50_013218 [Cerrena zonata]|uniref:PCI domain-containing protein n=1 Tax=Cerrena zonata TaxID=2478898 RepID=A0AAW0FUP1_9APHY